MSNKRILNHDKFVRILNELSKGKSVTAVRAEVGCGLDTVWKLAKEFPLFDQRPHKVGQ